MTKDIHSPVTAAPGIDFYVNSPPYVPGEPFLEEGAPKLFTPLKIKNITLPNRIGVSPMCQYAAQDGIPGAYHLAHYGSLVIRGPGITMVEASGVTPYAGITSLDLGIWNDEQAERFKEIVQLSHGSKALIGIQLAHSGRKGSNVPPYIHIERGASVEEGGWPDHLVAPSPIVFRDSGISHTPHALSIEGIKEVIKSFGAAAKRSVEIAGFDFVEIHGAHGYLINEFLSSTSNKRTDQYGGSFENRIRFLLEVIDEVRANVPKDYPVFLRISGLENTPQIAESWGIEDSIKLAHIVADKGIDLLDVSSGGNSSEQDKRSTGEAFQAPLAKAIKDLVGDKLLVATVGKIYRAELANELLENGTADLIFVGIPFLKNPGLVQAWADDLKVDIHGIRSYEYVNNGKYYYHTINEAIELEKQRKAGK